MAIPTTEHTASGSSSSSSQDDPIPHDQIDLYVGPAGELSTSGNPKARRFRAMLTVRRPKSAVWRVLTAYDQLADILPNLSVSRRLPLPPDGPYPNATGRVYQEGEQRIFGWKVPMVISTGVTLDFEEDEAAGTVKAFLVESALLQEFRAEWKLVEEKLPDGGIVTRMHYSGVACPRGPVPQRLCEWQLRRDVPMNLGALKAYAEAFDVTEGGTEDEEDGVDGEEGEFVLAEEGDGVDEEGQEQEEEEEMKDACAEPGEAGVLLAPSPVCCLPVRRLVSKE